MANNYHRNDLSAGNIIDLTTGLIVEAGCAYYAHADLAFIRERADKGWSAAEIARSFIRATFAKDNPPRRRFLTALTKLGAYPTKG